MNREAPYADHDATSTSRFDSGSSSRVDQAPSFTRVTSGGFAPPAELGSTGKLATSSSTSTSTQAAVKLFVQQSCGDNGNGVTYRVTEWSTGDLVDSTCQASSHSSLNGLSRLTVSSEPNLVASGNRRRSMDFIPTTPKRSKSLEPPQDNLLSHNHSHNHSTYQNSTFPLPAPPGPLRVPKRRQRRQIRWSQFDTVIQAQAHATPAAGGSMDMELQDYHQADTDMDSVSVLSSEASISTANTTTTASTSTSSTCTGTSSRDANVSMRLLSSTANGIQPARKQPVNVRRKGRYSTAGRLQQLANGHGNANANLGVSAKHHAVDHQAASSHRRWSQVTPSHHVLSCPNCTNDLLVDLAPAYQACNGYYPIQCPTCLAVAPVHLPLEQELEGQHGTTAPLAAHAHHRLSMLCDEAKP